MSSFSWFYSAELFYVRPVSAQEAELCEFCKYLLPYDGLTQEVFESLGALICGQLHHLA